jgi:hypothetical protein
LAFSCKPAAKSSPRFYTDVAAAGLAAATPCSTVSIAKSWNQSRHVVVYGSLTRPYLAISLVVAALLVSESPASPCQQCERSLDLRSTAAGADQVYVARRVGEEFKVDTTYGTWDTFAPFEVQAVLKGNPPDRYITVAVSGFCLMGLIADRNQPYLLFLEQRKDGFFPVNDGCAVPGLRVDGDRVAVAGTFRPLDELAREIGLRPPPSKSRRWWPLVAAGVLACLVTGIVGFVLGRRIRTT